MGGALSLLLLVSLIQAEKIRGNDVTAFLAVLCATLVVPQYFFGIQRRLRESPGVLPSLERSVLYLRAFDEESRPFVSGPRFELAKYTSQLTAHFPTRSSGRNVVIHLTLEDFLKRAITAKIGPFVGLGNPSDKLPADGAVREYAQDEAWQERFLALARSATCIVVALGQSANLDWELLQLRQHRLCRKVCLFIPPRASASRESLAKTLRTEPARAGALALAWEATCETMRRASYACDPTCPGPGSVVAFDEEARSIVLTTEARTPDDYVAPMADWFASGAMTGRCVRTTCPSCGGTIFQSATIDAANPGLCFTCGANARLAAMSGIERLFERSPWIEYLWMGVSLPLAAMLAALLSLDSGWVLFALWLLLGALPRAVGAGLRRLRRPQAL